MISIPKSVDTAAVSKAISTAASKLPKGVLFWGVVGAAAGTTAVFLFKPVRRGLTRLLSPVFGRTKSRKIVKKVAQRGRANTAVAKRAAHASVRRPRLAHAR